jgi:hypothetical protein
MKTKNWSLGLLGVVLAARYLYRTVVVPLPSLGPALSDFWWYYQAAQAILAGTSPFAVEDFAYPPLLAFLLTPLALLTYEAARWVWFAFSHACLVGAAYLVWRVAGAGRTALLAVLAVWACGGAIAESLMLGQLNPLLLLLVVLSWYPRREPAGAASVALAAALKIWPATLLAAYALLRRGRALVTGIAVILLLALLPTLATALLLGPPLSPPATYYWMGTPALFNFSLPAVLLRLLDPPAGTGRLPHNWEFGNNVHELNVPESHLWIAVAIAASVMALGLLLLWRWAASAPDSSSVPSSAATLTPGTTPLPLVSAALVSLTLAVSPVCWSHYQLLQYPGVALLLAGFVRQKRFRAAAALVAVFFGVYQFPILGLGPYLAAYGWTAANPALLWALTSMTPLCSLGLFVFYANELRTIAR